MKIEKLPHLTTKNQKPRTGLPTAGISCRGESLGRPVKVQNSKRKAKQIEHK